MSARTAVQGEFLIQPPLKWSEIRSSPFFVSDSSGLHDRDVRLAVSSVNAETDEGVTTIITCDRATPIAREYDPRNLLDDVRELHEELGPSHALRGQVLLYNLEEPDEIRRVVADADGVREESASVTWPDGTPLDLSR